MDLREKIIQEAAELMGQFGIRTVTMDDISKNLGISKKTLYQYFKDKKELVNKVTEMHLALEQARFDATAMDSEDSVQELILVSQCLRESLKDMKMGLMKELQKFYPDAWLMYEDFKQNVMMKTICQAIERGQAEGYFRQNINPQLIAIMRMEQVQAFFMTNLFPKEKLTIAEVQMHLFDHFIHGLFTLKGHQLFNQYSNIKENQDESLV